MDTVCKSTYLFPSPLPLLSYHACWMYANLPLVLCSHFSCSRCERLPCNENKECQSLPLRITYYHLSFPTNIQVPTDIFRMGPSNAVPGDKILLSIISGNQEGFFTTKKVNNHSGIVVMQRQITEPRDLLLTIQMQLTRHGTVNTFIAKLFVFVSAQLWSLTYRHKWLHFFSWE